MLFPLLLLKICCFRCSSRPETDNIMRSLLILFGILVGVLLLMEGVRCIDFSSKSDLKAAASQCANQQNEACRSTAGPSSSSGSNAGSASRGDASSSGAAGGSSQFSIGAGASGSGSGSGSGASRGSSSADRSAASIRN